ncbi:flavodoxin [Paenibacillus hodogayensis]|uniref:Flavodoxin n=1 Tax=Paenibacillus hodogayensis TaxID=279208 RepID=A0ABV5W670_9BACL
MKVIVVFASMTGNTEDMADAVAEGIREAGAEVVLKNVLDANASELTQYDAFVLGAYTWGDGELPDEFLDFYDELDDLDLSGKYSAVFGSADSSYPEFGKAVDLLVEKLEEMDTVRIAPPLKVELGPTSEEKEACRELGRQVAAAATGVK